MFYRAKVVRPLVFAVLFLITTCFAQRGAIVHPADLADLTDRAQTIVRARVVSARVEPHPQFNNLQTVVLTLAIKEAYKGNAASTLTIRQFIWDIRDKMDSMGYRKGQDYILFLNPMTKYGLTSTTGLNQGRFRVSTDAAGNEVVVNGSGNYGLLDGANTVGWGRNKPLTSTRSTTAQVSSSRPASVMLPQGEIPVTNFVKTIKSYVTTK